MNEYKAKKVIIAIKILASELDVSGENIIIALSRAGFHREIKEAIDKAYEVKRKQKDIPF